MCYQFLHLLLKGSALILVAGDIKSLHLGIFSLLSLQRLMRSYKDKVGYHRWIEKQLNFLDMSDMFSNYKIWSPKGTLFGQPYLYTICSTSCTSLSLTSKNIRILLWLQHVRAFFWHLILEQVMETLGFSHLCGLDANLITPFLTATLVFFVPLGEVLFFFLKQKDYEDRYKSSSLAFLSLLHNSISTTKLILH